MSESTEVQFDRFLKGLGFFTGMSIVGLLLAFPTMWTWNCVIPYLFGLPVLTWGKAWCLQFVCSLLFKSVLIRD